MLDNYIFKLSYINKRLMDIVHTNKRLMDIVYGNKKEIVVTKEEKVENENDLLKQKIKDLERENNLLKDKEIQTKSNNKLVCCNKNISDIINSNLWNEKRLNIEITGISTNKTIGDILKLLYEPRNGQIEKLAELSVKFKKFVDLYECIKCNKITKSEVVNLLSKWTEISDDAKYTDFFMSLSEHNTFIFNYFYYLGYIVIIDSDNTKLCTLISLVKYEPNYKIYYSNYVTNNTDTDIIGSDNIKEQIINNKNNIIISINEKSVTYFKIL